MQIHELAKELKISSAELLDKLKALGFKIKAHTSTVPAEAIRQLKKEPKKPKANKKPRARRRRRKKATPGASSSRAAPE